MANLCASLTSYTKQCNAGIAGGIERLYMVGYNDLLPLASGDVYTTASGSTIVSSISLSSGKTFVNVGILKESVSFKGTLKRDSSTNAVSNETETVVTISDMSDLARQFITSCLSQPVTFIIKLRSGKYIVSGLNGYTELTQVDEASGTKNADANGYTLTFTGVEAGLTRIIDPSIIASIVSTL